MATEMDGLPENVRAALRVFEGEAVCTCHEAYTSRGMKDPQCNHDLADEVAIIRAELLRLARENAELRTVCEESALNREGIKHAHRELAELKRKIAEAGKAAVHDDANLGPSLIAYMDATDLGKTFALLLLPLDDGGEG